MGVEKKLSKKSTALHERIKSEIPDHFVEQELKHGDIVWSDRSLNSSIFLDARAKTKIESFVKPLGIVVSGVLEVSEIHSKSKQLRTVTAILKEGHVFGLFEAIADIYGPWTIASGIQRIVFCGAGIATKKSKHELSGYSSDLDKTLRGKTGGNDPSPSYDYKKLFEKFNSHNLTKSVCFFFDLSAVKNLETLSAVNAIAIAQLTSYVHQNPADNHLLKVSKDDFDYDPKDRRNLSTLKAILCGRMPVYRLANDADEKAIPLQLLKQKLSNKNILMPDVIEESAIHNYIFFDYLGEKLVLSDLFSKLSQMFKAKRLIEPNGIELKKYSATLNAAHVSVGTTTTQTTEFILVRLQRPYTQSEASGKIFTIPESIPNLMGTWPDVLKSAMVIVPAAAANFSQAISHFFTANKSA